MARMPLFESPEKVGVHGPLTNVGWPIPGLTRVRVTDEVSGKPVRRGTTGQIEVGSVGQIAGFLKEKERTASRWNGSWWQMQDIGYLTWWGALRLAGRQVDAVAGVPDVLALEDKLMARLPELVEVVIIDALPGRLPTSVVCTVDDRPLNRQRWREAVEGLPSVEEPVQLRWAELPTTATWKVKRTELMAQLIAQEAILNCKG